MRQGAHTSTGEQPVNFTVNTRARARAYREEVSTVSELGSSGVAMLVTQPAWPTSVPRMVSCSAIAL